MKRQKDNKSKPLHTSKYEGLECVPQHSTVKGSNQGILIKVTVVELASSSSQTWEKRMKGFWFLKQTKESMGRI